MALQHIYSTSPTFTHSTFNNPPLPSPKLPQKPFNLHSLKEKCKQGQVKEAFISFTKFITYQNPSHVSLDEAYSSILDLCASRNSVAQAQQLHAHMVTSNLVSDSVFLSTKLVFMYGKCGHLSGAQKVFDEMPERTVFTWNAMIGGCVTNGRPFRALELYREMRVSDVPLDAHTFPSVLKACSLLANLDCGSEIHGFAVKCGFDSTVFVVNSLVAMYAKCDRIDEARQLFDRMIDKKDVVSWNSIISAYSANGQSREAINIFREMNKAGVAVNSYTIVGALQACEDPSFVKLGEEIHGVILKADQQLQLYVANALLVMYSSCGRIDEALRIFHGINEKDNVSWNSMLSGFIQNELYTEAVEFFHEMCEMSLKIDEVSHVSVLSALGRLGNLSNGMEVHAYAAKHGLVSNLQIANTLMDMYAKCGNVSYMGQVFYNMAYKDFISWTTVIAGNAQNSSYSEALELFRKVQSEGIKVDCMMIGSILLACGGLKSVSHTKQIHNYIIRRGLFDLVLENSLVDVYGECGEINYASQMFETIKNKDVVSWTSMVSSFSCNGLANEALELCHRMGEAGIELDLVALLSVLSASASLSTLKAGKEVHGLFIRKGFPLERSSASSLIDMYARCGTVENACKIFDYVGNRDIVLYTSMINAYGMHGQGKKAISLFEKMISSGLVPDHITYLALLYACSHSGLINEGREFFRTMKSDYQLEPWTEHYACVVDLLGRANCVDDAYNFVKNMPIEPPSVVWCALLGACRVHSNFEIGEIAARKLLELEPQNPGNHVLVSNVFAAMGRWKDVDEVRMRMSSLGMKKKPACSWIEIGNKIHAFRVQDKSHPQSIEIYSKVSQITERLEKEGRYLADTKFVLHNMTEEEKKKMLYGHSERLTIAYALIVTSPGVPIRITKNLRVCGDCHTFTKLVSKFIEREIIVRDANRFHHFKNGRCSCGDFW
ncbi:hypothetical protein Scep_009733 [Stephania cephalantha]|uniref:DYW domain-containing protein n=1 Tax=Stephania cephalantha TaxID=152367 RepID=A0AAP0JTT1_9MAGN